jgi:hypothetical protein
MHPTLHSQKVEILNSFALDESREKVRRNLWFSNLFQEKSGKEIMILAWVSGKRCQELEILSQVKSEKKSVIL